MPATCTPPPVRPSRLRPALPALLVALALTAFVASPGTALASAVPATPSFTAAIDSYASYLAEDTCSPTAKPGLVDFQALLDRTYGRQSIDNIVRPCSSSVSGHEEGRALDFGLDAASSTEFGNARALLGWLLATDSYGNRHAMARRLGIMYMQYDNRMWRAYDPPAGTPLEQWPLDSAHGCTATTTGSTTCHDDHIHFSFGWDGAYERTSFFRGRVPCAAPTTQVPAPPVMPTQPSRFTPLPATLLLYTVTGYGMPNGACTPSSTNRYDLPVLGHAGVPSSGVASVDLLVMGLNPSVSSGSLSAAPSGAAWTRSGAAYATPATYGTSALTLPVGADGQVSLRVGNGLMDVLIYAIGYRSASGLSRTAVPSTMITDATGATALKVGETRSVRVAGVGALPATGVSVADLGVTIRAGTTAAAVGVGQSASEPMPSLRVGAGGMRTITTSARVAPNGTVVLVNRSSTPVSVKLTAQGWYGAAATSRLVATTPYTVLDTASGIGHAGPLPANQRLTVVVAPRGEVPSGARAVLLDLTTSGAPAPGVLWVWANGAAVPTSVRTFTAGDTGAGLVVVPVGTGGAVSLSSLAAISLNARVVGYYA